MDTETQKILKEKFLALPDDVKQAILSLNLTAILQSIGKKNALMIDQLGLLETEVMIVLLGLESPDNFSDNIKRQLKISPYQGNVIAKDVNELMLKNIYDSLKKIQQNPEEEEIPKQFEVSTNYNSASNIPAIKKETISPTPTMKPNQNYFVGVNNQNNTIGVGISKEIPQNISPQPFKKPLFVEPPKPKAQEQVSSPFIPIRPVAKPIDVITQSSISSTGQQSVATPNTNITFPQANNKNTRNISINQPPAASIPIPKPPIAPRQPISINTPKIFMQNNAIPKPQVYSNGLHNNDNIEAKTISPNTIVNDQSDKNILQNGTVRPMAEIPNNLPIERPLEQNPLVKQKNEILPTKTQEERVLINNPKPPLPQIKIQSSNLNPISDKLNNPVKIETQNEIYRFSGNQSSGYKNDPYREIPE